MEKVGLHICIPSTGSCKALFTFSLARMLLYFQGNRCYPETKQQSVTMQMAQGSGISQNREKLVTQALEDPDCTHILFLDEDMGFMPDTLNRLFERRQPIVICNYRMRKPPGTFTAVVPEMGRRIETNADKKGMEEAMFGGFGFSLFERKVFESLQKPWFLCQYDAEAAQYTTEDFPFYKAARDAGYKCLIDQDASKNIWHIGEINYRWDHDYTALETA